MVKDKVNPSLEDVISTSKNSKVLLKSETIFCFFLTGIGKN